MDSPKNENTAILNRKTSLSLRSIPLQNSINSCSPLNSPIRFSPLSFFPPTNADSQHEEELSLQEPSFENISKTANIYLAYSVFFLISYNVGSLFLLQISFSSIFTTSTLHILQQSSCASLPLFALFLSIIHLFAQGFGAVCYGSLADLFGRKVTLLYALVILVLGIVIQTFCSAIFLRYSSSYKLLDLCLPKQRNDALFPYNYSLQQCSSKIHKRIIDTGIKALSEKIEVIPVQLTAELKNATKEYSGTTHNFPVPRCFSLTHEDNVHSLLNEVHIIYRSSKNILPITNLSSVCHCYVVRDIVDFISESRKTIACFSRKIANAQGSTSSSEVSFCRNLNFHGNNFLLSIILTVSTFILASSCGGLYPIIGCLASESLLSKDRNFVMAGLVGMQGLAYVFMHGVAALVSWIFPHVSIIGLYVLVNFVILVPGIIITFLVYFYVEDTPFYVLYNMKDARNHRLLHPKISRMARGDVTNYAYNTISSKDDSSICHGIFKERNRKDCCEYDDLRSIPSCNDDISDYRLKWWADLAKVDRLYAGDVETESIVMHDYHYHDNEVKSQQSNSRNVFLDNRHCEKSSSGLNELSNLCDYKLMYDYMKISARIRILKYAAMISGLFQFSSRSFLGICVPWAMIDIVFYGYGMVHFILVQPAASTSETFWIRSLSSFIVTSFTFTGYLITIRLMRSFIPKMLQMFGFILLAFTFFGLSVCLYSIPFSSIEELSENTVAMFFYNFIFRYFLCIPNVTTFLIPLVTFHTRVRGTCHGLAMGFARFCAIVSIIVISQCRSLLNVTVTLVCIFVLMIVAATFTLWFTPHVLSQNGNFYALDKHIESLS